MIACCAGNDAVNEQFALRGSMKIKPTLSNALRIASFVAAVLVVAIHANMLHCVAEPTRWNQILHYALCECLNQWAVPFFFTMSGFWFVLGRYVTQGGYKSFLAGKCKTLLLPYMLWVLIATIIGQPAIICANLLAHRPLLTHSVFALISNPWDFVNSLFAITNTSPMHLGVLWYVRALLILFLLAPLWRFMATKSRAWILLIVFAFVRCFSPSGYIPGIALRYLSAYFLLGIVIAVYLPRRWLESCAGSSEMCKSLPRWVGMSFWLYCIHNIILAYMLSAGHALLGKTNVAIAILTPLSTVLCCVVALPLGLLVQRKWPKAYALLSGSR